MRLPGPTRRIAALALLMGAIPLLAPFPAGVAFVLTSLGVAALFVLDAVAATSPLKITIERQFPSVVPLGSQASLSWRIHASRRSIVTFADALPPSLKAQSRRFRVVVPKGATATVDTTIQPTRRGILSINELTLRSFGPLGLAFRQRRRLLGHQLRVYPSFRSRKEAEMRLDKARVAEVGLRSARGRGGGTEFDQLREYGVDDDVRRMDWSATARSQKPIVRTYRPEQNQTVVSVLDTGRVMAGLVGEVPRLEHAMDAVMMLTTLASRLGDRGGLLAFGSTVRAAVAPESGRRQLERVNEAMFALEPELNESDYRSAFAQALVTFPRRTMFVVLTDLAEEPVRESLLPAMPLVARRHLVVVAGVRDPDILRWAEEMPKDVTSIYRSAAAGEALEQRRRSVALLRGAGAIVVDAAPGELATRLADTYFEVKASGRL